jgi:hypothetical protein
MGDAELKALFAAKLSSDAKWVRRAIVAIYKNQTEEEQRIGETIKHNGIGFTGADARILTSFARQIEANRFSFSEEQLKLAFKLMPKYAGQLVKIVKGKI